MNGSKRSGGRSLRLELTARTTEEVYGGSETGLEVNQ